MVAFKTWTVIFFTLLPLCLMSEDVQVSSQADQLSIYENTPVKGMITVTHDENAKIDTNSFIMDNKPLKVEFVQSTKISSDNPLTVTIYRFEIPGKAKGLYVLPEVSVKVGGKVYRSFPTSYEVRENQQMEAPSETPTQTPPATSSEDVSFSKNEGTLKLEAVVDGKNPLYPGETLRFIYRFYFSGNIELTKEELPLLDAEGFLKVGDKEIKDYAQDQLSVNEITQFVEAQKPGKYTFGPSIAEGKSYQQDSAGHRTYSKTPLKSEAEAVTVVVKPFPEEGKPASFSGAVGKFNLGVSLKSAEEVNVGDEMSLLVTISGTGNFRTVNLPDLCCQPGFSGFFRLSDLPPTSEVRGDVKNFTVELQPLTDTLKEIPSVEFSFFNPNEEKYVVLHSKPIPINVRPAKPLPVENLDETKSPPGEQQRTQELVPEKPEAIEIQTIYDLDSEDLYNRLFGTWLSLSIIPLGIAFLIYQKTVRDAVMKRKKIAKSLTSKELFDRAFQEKTATPLFFDLLNKALKQSLVEAKAIPDVQTATEKLPDVGLSGEVRRFLSSIDEKRFTGQGHLTPSFLRESAQTLFAKIQKNISENSHAV